QSNASPAFIVNSIRSGDLDVYLGGWMPTEKGLIDPPAEAGEVKVAATNISNALMGLAVPNYVWEAGVHSVTDLADFADKFNHKIYAIEPGAGFNEAIQNALDENDHGLGDWQMIPSSTSGMLVQVERAINNEQWITILGWEPHWMNIKYDMEYLEPEGEPDIASTTRDLLTGISPDMAEEHPDLDRFFTQYTIEKATMSEWILEYGYEEHDADDVAEQWIGDNLDKVAVWLDGVEDRDGDPAMDAVRTRYADE